MHSLSFTHEYNMYGRNENIYSQHELFLTLFTHGYHMYCRFLFTRTLRILIIYYPWLKLTTAFYSWVKTVEFVSSMCVFMRNKSILKMLRETLKKSTPPPASKGHGDGPPYSIATPGHILRNCAMRGPTTTKISFFLLKYIFVCFFA